MPSSSPPAFSAYPLEDYRQHKQAIDDSLARVLEKGHYILGNEVTSFEKEFAAYTRTKHCIGVANGTDAIEVILRALNIGQGCKVALPSHTAVASASGIARAGATPVFVDIDLESRTLCPLALESLLSSPQGENVKAVLAVHLYGHPCEMASLQSVADKHGVILLEDCAQAHGATYQGKSVGSLARAAAFSFYPTKNLGAIGDGGGITTNDSELADQINVIRQYGWKERYISACEGVNSRLDELQAALLRVKLQTLPASILKRRQLAALYQELLKDTSVVTTPVCKQDCEHAYHLYVVRSSRRDALMKHLLNHGVPAALHYPAAIHQQPGYFAIANQSPPLPNTDTLIKQILTLPLHPYLSEEAIRFTCEAIRSFEHQAA
ncbi:MAG: Erythromycin biosynthesis sensory transduction protein EryC1 [Verrucomicrobiota bacterium]|jgi:dTDP-4-amino-4,6-dideoxygalactose transaminase